MLVECVPLICPLPTPQGNWSLADVQHVYGGQMFLPDIYLCKKGEGGGGCILFFPESFYTTYKTTVEMTKLIFKWYLNLMSSGQNWMLWWCRKLLFWNVITINAFCAMLKVTYQLVLLNVYGLLNLIPSQFLVSSWVSWTVFLNRMSYSHDNFKDSQGGSFFLFSFLWYPGYSDRNAVTWERKLL